MKRLTWVVALVLLSGCGFQDSQPTGVPRATSSVPVTSNSQVESGSAATTPPGTQPSDPRTEDGSDKIKSGRLTAWLRSSSGKKAQFYLYAPNEQVRVEDAPSCMANSGDTIRTGNYEFYLTSETSNEPQRQSVAPYPDTLLSFNDRRPQYLQVLPGEADNQPDLLVLMQYGSCNGKAVAILALSTDGRQLVHYRFKAEDGRTWNTTGTGVLEQPRAGVLRTSRYNNAIGKTTTTTWEVHEAEALLVAVKTEVR